MSVGWNVKAQDITQWTEANRRQAQEILPLLVKKLILASTISSSLHFPVGDSILHSGWDGTLTSKKGNEFVPEGESVWELSTMKKINQKANEDYLKRTNKTRVSERKIKTYVFVTTQIWKGKETWVKTKNAEARWKDVRALNSVDLECWIEMCPAVHRWFARVIGKRSEKAIDVEQAWEAWSCVTKPPSRYELIIAGRDEKLKEVVDRLKLSSSVVRIHSESEEESYAFALVVVSQYSEFKSRFLVVTEENEWNALVECHNSLILLPRFSNPKNIGLAIQRGHSVILPGARFVGKQQSVIELDKPSRNKLVEALISMGLKEDDAKTVVQTSRGYLKPIRRHQKLEPYERSLPEWTKPENSSPLIAALLVGAWAVDNPNDCAQVEKLADIPYEKMEEKFYYWTNSDDPPVRRVGNVWQVLSRQDAWMLLSQYVNPVYLDRFCKVAEEVLRELHPRFELKPEERWMANVYGKKTRYSGVLRQSLAEAIAMLGAYGDQDCISRGEYSISDKMSVLVRSLLKDDMSGNRWGSLAHYLPLFAEAAPEIFLECVETGLQSENPSIMELFVEEGDMGACLHSGLLWALEGISWNKEHFPRTVRIFAKLARLDPGGRYSNRPFNSLQEIFLGWKPQTKVSLQERIRVLSNLMQNEPEICWKLLLSLLPEHGEISTRIHQPYFRDWAEDWEPTVTEKEYFDHVVAISDLCLMFIDAQPNIRWPMFLDKKSHLPKNIFDKTITILSKKGKEDFSSSALIEIYEKLNKIISRHRRYSDASWALQEDELKKLEGILEIFIPIDLVAKHLYLFDTPLPDIPEVNKDMGLEQQMELIDQYRRKGLEAIWKSEGFSGIERLASKVKANRSIGDLLARLEFTAKIESKILNWLDSPLSPIAQTYVGTMNASDNTWKKKIHKKYKNRWSKKIWVSFCLGLPFNRDTFEFLKVLSVQVSDNYWEKIDGCFLQNDDAEYANWVVEQLLDHKRPLAAIDVAMMCLHSVAKKTGIDNNLLARALEQAAIAPEEKSSVPRDIGFDICEVLKYLQSTAEIDETRLARIEWMYMQVFSHGEARPITLINEVLKNPGFFAHLISLTSKARPPIKREFADLSDKKRKRLAIKVYELLRLINRIPGQKDDGSINSSVLNEWVRRTREECFRKNRVDLGDQHIGQILSFSPTGKDGIWPHEVVRDILEKAENQNIERGLEISRYNQRGMTSREVGEGGGQERNIAVQYDMQADKINLNWPKTAAMLRRIANSYKGDAKRWDIKAELED